MGEERGWSAAAQKAFEQALSATRSHPASERWVAVAELVPGKSKSECIARVRADTPARFLPACFLPSPTQQL